jgi:hypothetical protein
LFRVFSNKPGKNEQPFFMPDLSHVKAIDWAIMAFGWAFFVGNFALLAYWSEKHPSRRS